MGISMIAHLRPNLVGREPWIEQRSGHAQLGYVIRPTREVLLIASRRVALLIRLRKHSITPRGGTE